MTAVGTLIAKDTARETGEREMLTETRSGGGQLVRQWRLHAGLSQGELAARSNVSERTIRGLENGSIRSPHAHTITALARALRLERDDFARLSGAWERRLAPNRDEGSVRVVSGGRGVHEAIADVVVQALRDGCGGGALRYRIEPGDPIDPPFTHSLRFEWAWD
jgi:transcriptional regulator with XRE-family HTH domain